MRLARLFDWPPVWTFGTIALTALLARVLPVPLLDMLFSGAILRPLAYGVAALAAGLMLWAAGTMALARATVIPHREPTALVAHGPFRYSRNPIYLADLGFLTAAGLYLGSVWPLIGVPALAWILTRRFIEREEAALASGYPEAWAAWSARVGRWF